MAKKLVWVLLGIIIFGKPAVAVSAAEDYPEESKQQCEYGVSGASGNVPRYKKADGSVIEAERTDAGLNFATTVPGIQCAQVKSDPITLQEIVPYSLLSQPMCESIHNWSGNLEIQNVVTPFAKTIADHWAGTLDAEYFDEKTLEAMTGEEKMRYSGVLGKLLTQEQKDKLRADFIDYVKKQGAKSMYANMMIYGTKITDIKRPEKDSDDRKAWDKIPFFPNEQVAGQVKFNVCGDQQYRTYPAYQELMRLGLAGNQLFKLLQPADVQKKYFSANPDLKEPYKYLTTGQFPISNLQFSMNEPIFNDPIFKKETIFDRIKSFLAGILGKAKEVLAADCVPLEGGVEVSPTDPSKYSVYVRLTPCGRQKYINSPNSKGAIGDIYIYMPGGSPHIQNLGWDPNNQTGELRYFCDNPDAATFIGSCGNLEGRVFCFRAATIGMDQVCFTYGGAKYTPPPPVETPACSPTKDGCDPTCNICKLARFGPPFTVDGDPNGKTMNSKKLEIGTVNYTWDKTPEAEGWKKTPRVKPDSCTVGAWVKDTVGNKQSCTRHDDCAIDEGCRGGFCGVLECEKDHDRTVNVYNNVPYLYSLWEQTTSKDLGFLTLFKPEDTKGGQGALAGENCTVDQNIVFDKDGNFSPAPGAAKVKYVFEETGKQGVKSVTMTTPPERNLMFYRLGGVCNANKWFSEKVLAPTK